MLPPHYIFDCILIFITAIKYPASAADHRHFSLHVHHPLSKPPADSRRKRTSEGRKEGRRGSAPNTATTIEEDQEEEEGKEESFSHNDGEGGRTATPTRWVTHLIRLVTQIQDLVSNCLFYKNIPFFIFVHLTCNSSPSQWPAHHLVQSQRHLNWLHHEERCHWWCWWGWHTDVCRPGWHQESVNLLQAKHIICILICNVAYDTILQGLYVTFYIYYLFFIGNVWTDCNVI